MLNTGGVAESMATDKSIGDEEILVAIDHLNNAVRASSDAGSPISPDVLRVKRILEEVATQRNLLA
ncbi:MULTISPECIES: hypothetical protein [unclassified Rhizobium]|uniref:hypothetical protein n=1 Tax=unclassified Rhizobium TaxID=2613769 RepID=UPI001615F75C|nr:MULTISPECIES: hypothetical protein [unclassified Rhizobium]MBB3545139.1 hypothetical protein [Rhizobium sp. BK399]MCS3743897.1 hypothetical protein [Rhizobium sp. BK661]MCS4095993.1 hypothetical protein [Rhizobium sp. BK176]